MIIWIASYPKSGNTWVRMFLRSYFLPDGKSFSINSKGSDAFEALNFPETKTLQELNIDFIKFENIVKNWVSIQDYINLNNKTNFLKTHNGNFTINNYPFTNTDNTAGGIYIVRDPRDVAISMSHHSNMNNESVVEYLITNQHEIAHIDKNSKKEKQDSFKKSIMGTWSMNYLSWKSYKGRKIHFVRYEDLINDTKNDILELWSIFTTNLHFTIARPIIAMYILLKFGLFDINEKTKPMAKMMSIILIVVATSAILELIQSVIPINQMITAALLGIIIAFGIGWEEKSFHKLINNPADLRSGIDKKWFPEIDIPMKYIRRIDWACMIYCLVALLVSFIIWQMDILVTIAIERGA